MPESTLFPVLQGACTQSKPHLRASRMPGTSGHPDEGTVFRDLTLLFKQKLLLQHFQGEKISPKNSVVVEKTSQFS